MPQEDLGWALKHYHSSKMREYARYDSYYDGEQPLAYATEKFRNVFGNLFKEFAENICSPVVDSLSDRLQIIGFKTNRAEVKTEQETTSLQGEQVTHTKVVTEDPTADLCLDIWRRNRMDLKAGEVHTESLKEGDAYVIVWPNDDQKAEIWPQCAWECCIDYDPNIQGNVLKAAKVWWDDNEGYWYVNVYYPTHIEKYVARKQGNARSMTLPEKEGGFELYEVVNNPYGRVPVFHFPNVKVRQYGTSELMRITPIQDGLNKACMDMIIAMEFASFKQRWVIGLEMEIDEATGEPIDPTAKNYGVDRLLAFPDLETKVGQFDATDLSQFLKVQEKFWASAARISGTPLHYFFIQDGDFPSGEAMKSAEARFVKKITDRQTAFGNIWEDVLKFCLAIDEGDNDPDLQIDSKWVYAAPRSESEIADTAVKKQSVGVSRSQILRELGYDEDEIMRMLQESDADAMRKAELSAKGRGNEEGQKEGQEKGKKVPVGTGPGKGVPR